MLAVLDPLLLQFDDASGLEPLPRAALEDLVWMLAKRRALIPSEGSYWKPMVTEILRPLALRMAEDPHYKRLLDQLMRQAQQVTLAPIAEATELSGFDLMFDRLGPNWPQVMRHLLARCAQTDETILVTRLIPGRNARVRDHDGRPALVEKLCWELGAHPAAVAVAWLLSNPVVSSTIVGAMTVEELNLDLRALSVHLDAEVLERLDRIWPGPGEAPQAYAW